MGRSEPRIRPGDAREIGRISQLVAVIFGHVQGTGPLNLFTTLARHRPLYRGWLRFAGALMLRGVLPRRDTELVILRVAHNCSCEYEWRHHERIARTAGLSGGEIARVRAGALAPGWSDRQAALLQATDELHEHREIRDFVWPKLRILLDDRELIELCMLVGHYEMLAMTVATLRIQPDQTHGGGRVAPSARLAAGAISALRGGSGRRGRAPEPYRPG
ncbi:MAG: carboxymuconolactone decarboxylase family protein [Acidobacteriota bacterium]|nr:carboxymuconolactone decarboxylase family protein [Acidobacteriota bacterium]